MAAIFARCSRAVWKLHPLPCIIRSMAPPPPPAGSAEMVEELAAVDAEDGPRAFLAVESDRPGQGLEPKVHTGCGGTRGCWPVLVAKGYQRRVHITIKVGKQALDDC